MNFTDREVDMLMAGCRHYRNVYADLGHLKTRDAYDRLRLKLQDYKDDRRAYFNDEINININKQNIMRIACEIYGKQITDPRGHPGYDDDCHL